MEEVACVNGPMYRLTRDEAVLLKSIGGTLYGWLHRGLEEETPAPWKIPNPRLDTEVLNCLYGSGEGAAYIKKEEP